jgi:hypothetical protein
MSIRHASTLGFLVVTAAVPLATYGQVTYRPVALTGTEAPGMPAGTTFLRFETDPTANDAGGVAFRAVLRDASGRAAGSAIFANSGTGPTQLVAHQNDPAPGAPAGTTYGVFDPTYLPVLGNDGRVTFAARPIPNGYFWIYSGSFGSPGAEPPQVIRIGDRPPGTEPGTQFMRFDPPYVSRTGHIAFSSRTTRSGATNLSTGIWAGPASPPQRVALSNDPAPGMPAGVTYGQLVNRALGNDGRVVYTAALAGPGVTPANGLGLFAGLPGATQLVARLGNQAPGAPAGVAYDGFQSPVISGNGKVVYRATLSGAGVPEFNDGVFSANVAAGTAPQLVAREGDAVPGMPGVNYGGISSLLDVDNAGRVAFYTGLAGDGVNSQNNGALVLAAPGGATTLIAREGDDAHGTWGGVQFASPHVAIFDLNNAGQVVYEADLTGWATTAANNKALYLYDPALGSTLVARTGDRIEVGGGDFRTIAPGGISLLYSDYGSGFGDDGRVAFTLRFTDSSSGIFVAAVPEPSAIGAICLGAALLLRRRRN